MTVTRIRTAPPPQNIIIGTFLFLAAAVVSVAPAPLALSSAGILLCAYLALSVGGMPFGLGVALGAPVIGLITGDSEWLIMLPIMLSTNLLAMLGLEFGWRYAALAISPIMAIMPPLMVSILSRQSLFEIELPWGVADMSWVLLHGLVAAAGVLVALYLDRRRDRATK